MEKRITNPSYSYLGDNVISYSCLVELYQNGQLIDSVQVSTTKNQANPDWAEEMALDIKSQIDAYVAKFQEIFVRGITRFPAATSVDTILSEFSKYVEGEVNK